MKTANKAVEHYGAKPRRIHSLTVLRKEEQMSTGAMWGWIGGVVDDGHSPDYRVNCIDCRGSGCRVEDK